MFSENQKLKLKRSEEDRSFKSSSGIENFAVGQKSEISRIPPLLNLTQSNAYVSNRNNTTVVVHLDHLSSMTNTNSLSSIHGLND